MFSMLHPFVPERAVPGPERQGSTSDGYETKVGGRNADARRREKYHFTMSRSRADGYMHTNLDHDDIRDM